MSKVDWSLAPEGATHYGIVTSNRICWYAVKSASRYDYAYQNEGFNAEKWTPSGGNPGHLPLIARPQPKPWSGPEDGLPPVGVECEVDHGNGKHWDKVTILAHHGEKAIYLDPIRGIHYIWGLLKDFRTIRTTEQLAEEEREMAVADLDQEIRNAGAKVARGYTAQFLAEHLYDAGFKRDVK